MAWQGVKAGFQKRKRRRERRREKRNASKNENTYLGGSKDEERALYSDAKEQSQRSSERADGAYDRTSEELDNTRGDQDMAERDYRSDRTQARGALRDQKNGVGDIYERSNDSIGVRNSALNSGSLVGSTDSVLASRDAKLAGAPTIGQATEDAILANQANAQAMQKFTTGQINKGAMGLAAGQGESGALALQSAMAGAAGATGQAAAQQNLQAAQMNAGMRFDAAAQQRAETLGLANSAADAQLAAAAQERANQLAVAGANAEQIYGSALATQQARQGVTQAAQGQQGASSQANRTLQGQRANLATGNAQIANQGEQIDKGFQSDILTAKYNAGQARNAEEGRPLWKKAVLPFGILGN